MKDASCSETCSVELEYLIGWCGEENQMVTIKDVARDAGVSVGTVIERTEWRTCQ